MKKYLITSPKFKGTIELFYNFEGLLCMIDLNDAVLTYTQLVYLLGNVSPALETATGLTAGTELVMTEAPFEITLEDFKLVYPYSRNYHLLDKYWPTVTKKIQAAAYFAAKQYRRYCERNANWYKPQIAHSWLSKKEYLNDWRKM